MSALKLEKKPPPGRYVRIVNDGMPERKLKITYARRTAGAGSLGRPRYVGLAQWRGAAVVREAKAALPSAWTRLKGRGAKTLRCYEIATGAYRAPTMWWCGACRRTTASSTPRRIRSN
jgi:hypothetical protein